MSKAKEDIRFNAEDTAKKLMLTSSEADQKIKELCGRIEQYEQELEEQRRQLAEARQSAQSLQAKLDEV